MTKILTPLVTKDLDNCKYVELVEPFSFYSKVLKCKVTVPPGFVYDYESVPVVRGTNKRGGTAHDYLCRIDSQPVVSKAVAAEVYREIMEYSYKFEERSLFSKLSDWTRRWVKWGVVRVAWGYYHKFKVMATYEEIAGLDPQESMKAKELEC